jgi:penicillin amidase
MPRSRSKGRLVVWILLAILALLALLVAVAMWEMHRSLPQVDGQARLPGLRAPVTIARDSLGTAVVKGTNRLDVARGLGYVHAQERFFEMDLTRRSAAGELSELFGAVALERDRTRRLHRMRAMLAARYAALDAGEQALLQAYADGVNAGLAGLEARPWQYMLLRAEPRPWQPVDSLLVVGEMFWMLQGSSVEDGLERAQLRECVGDDVFDWLEPRGGTWDAAIDGSVLEPGAMPGPDRLDLRKPLPPLPASGAAATVARVDDAAFLDDEGRPDPHEPLVGSNNWAVSGARSITGDAMLANDMHLGLGVPAIWFRAQFEIGDGPDVIRAEGVTLPGVPAMVAGSNGHVAWGFTNSYGQWFDWIRLPAQPDASRMTHVPETIHVKGGDDVAVDIAQFAGLPVLEKDGVHAYALRWAADMAGAYDLGLDRMLGARDVATALAIGAGAGIPHQNMLVADAHGDIGWTIAGRRLPFGQDPGGAAVADGFGRVVPGASIAAADARAPLHGVAPVVEAPADGLLWTANARTFDQAPAGGAVASGVSARVAGLRPIGDGGYDLGARARQIRDRLRATPRFDEQSLGAIQFDDEALFLRPWSGRIAGVATGPTARPDVIRLLRDWNGRADADQAGYRLVREVRGRVMDALWTAWTRPLLARPACARRDYKWHARFEYAVEQALDTQPAHLLPPGFATWDAFLLAQVDATVESMTRDGARPLAQATWGESNASHIGHPLTRALPVLSRWLDMPSHPQSGDGNMPRVSGPSFGQSERLVVAPGHEERATLSMPGGQSGHPMSPWYGAGHTDWVAGRPVPLLAGPARHILELDP